jgi:prevent-host-death family protein
MTRKRKNPTNHHRKAASLLLLESREISASDFKARCLELMDEVERLGIEIVITKHRKPVARLVPHRAASGGFVGSMKGMVTVLGDIVSPTGEAWEADESNLT